MSNSTWLWSQIIEMSQMMLDHAQKDQWGEVTEIEAQRQEIIKKCFDAPVPLSEVTAVRANIQNMMEADQKIVTLGENRRSRLAAEIQGHKHSRKACQSYQRCG